MNSKIKLAVIYGSVRKGRFCDTVAAWALGRIARHGGFEVDVIDPALPGTAPEQASNDQAGRPTLKVRLGRADAFVVVTPEYNHSFPAPLKALIDSVYDEWQAKPVAFVSYGGISGGLRAVEHLRGVFAELHAVGLRDSVSFANARAQFDADGALRDPAAAEQGMATLLARLAWWAVTLRNGREASAYAKAAA